MRRSSVLGVVALGMAVIATVAARANAEALGSSSTDISGANSRVQETTAGNLLADAVRAAEHADAAIVAADALTTATIAKGPVSRNDLKSLLSDPDDEVTMLSLTGAELRNVLERGVSAHPKPFDGFLQVSGITMEFNSGKTSGPRIISLRVNGSAVDPKRRYHIATMSTLASGGLGYFKMWGSSDVSSDGKTVMDALADYIRAQKTVSPHIEGRIVAH